MKQSVLCLDIGGSFIKSAISCSSGIVTDIRDRPTPIDSWHSFSHAIQDIINDYGDKLSNCSPLSLSCAGVVDSVNDKILSSNIPAFKDRVITHSLSEILGRKVIMANDADCFTLAEACTGMGRDHPIVLGIILGSGVGGGIAINGQLLNGNQGIFAEWGHGPITRTEVTINNQLYQIPRLSCGCGQQGCIDTLGAARGIERLHRHLHQESATSRDIVTLGLEGQPSCLTTLQVWLELISEPLAHTINILGPHCVVVGGGLANEPRLISMLDQRVRSQILIKTTEPFIQPGVCSHNGGLTGASVLGHRLS